MADPASGEGHVEKRDDGAGRVTQPAPDQDVAGRGESRLRTTVRRQVGVIAAAGSAAPGPKGELYRNFGDGFTRAFELAFTPAIFGAIGYAIDRWLGVVPVFTTVLVLLTLVGLLLRVWYGYVYRMQALEASGPWARQPVNPLGVSPAPAVTEAAALDD